MLKKIGIAAFQVCIFPDYLLQPLIQHMDSFTTIRNQLRTNLFILSFAWPNVPTIRRFPIIQDSLCSAQFALWRIACNAELRQVAKNASKGSILNLLVPVTRAKVNFRMDLSNFDLRGLYCIMYIFLTRKESVYFFDTLILLKLRNVIN